MDGEDIERMLDLVGMDYDDEHQQHEQHESQQEASNSLSSAEPTSSAPSTLSSSGFVEPSTASDTLDKNQPLLNSNTTLNTTTSASSRTKDIFYGENYFDLHDILAQNQRINVKFLRTIPQLGFLDPSLGNDEADIEKGSKLGKFCLLNLTCHRRNACFPRIAVMGCERVDQ